jgi:ribokinase
VRILNFGSLNIDHVYTVDHFVRPGETMSSESFAVYPGGKGANQSTALARAGADVAHAGKIGSDGAWYVDRLREAGIDTTHIDTIGTPSGHAVIQVNKEGENAIILFGGANQRISDADAARVIGGFSEGDYLLLQNEISAIPAIMRRASDRGMRVVFNPAPMHGSVLEYPLELVTMFIVNEIEGAELTGEREVESILNAMVAWYPDAATVLTLGGNGVRYALGDERRSFPAVKVEPLDTTAAGDTFIGYFLAGLVRGGSIEEAVTTATRAAAICVTRKGAAGSIPTQDEVDRWSP